MRLFGTQIERYLGGYEPTLRRVRIGFYKATSIQNIWDRNDITLYGLPVENKQVLLHLDTYNIDFAQNSIHITEILDCSIINFIDYFGLMNYR